ncbi:MAG: phosphate ABC transporter substrate-binding protein PstS [Acidimicrobiia bacterium]|nr:phosphate ABC transporter substrate-binding protein PstS [Acidimicrobiia bacterium]
MRLPGLVLPVLLVSAVACGGGAPSGSEDGGAIDINGAGATFPYPIYSKWFFEYHALRPDVRINYQSIGSGGGIRQLTNRTVFFGASDGPMTEDQIAAAPGAILHLPTVLGAVVPIYNVPGLAADLRFDGTLLADIYLGTVTKWNDPAIARLNPGVALPADDIVVVHRSDGSGTTFVFVDFLSKVSPAFRERVGVATAVSWPTGVGGKGNEGVAGLVSQTPGSIGYVELVYAEQNRIAHGAVRNAAGAFIRASPAAVTAAAAEAAANMPADFRVSITNAPGEAAYPIASFTWLLLYEQPEDKARSRAMVEFMRWALTDGQQHCEALGYAPLPPEVVSLELAALERVAVS